MAIPRSRCPHPYVPLTHAAARCAQVVRDVQVDCALAELYHRGLSTQRQLAEARQGEAMNSVYTRLGEMEDMLSLVQQVRP